MSGPVVWVVVAVLACGLLLAAVWWASNRADDAAGDEAPPRPLDEFERWDKR